MASMKHGHAKGRRKKYALFSAGRTLGYIAFVRGTFCGAVRVLVALAALQTQPLPNHANHQLKCATHILIAIP